MVVQADKQVRLLALVLNIFYCMLFPIFFHIRRILITLINLEQYKILKQILDIRARQLRQRLNP